MVFTERSFSESFPFWEKRDPLPHPQQTVFIFEVRVEGGWGLDSPLLPLNAALVFERHKTSIWLLNDLLLKLKMLVFVIFSSEATLVSFSVQRKWKHLSSLKGKFQIFNDYVVQAVLRRPGFSLCGKVLHSRMFKKNSSFLCIWIRQRYYVSFALDCLAINPTVLILQMLRFRRGIQ